MPPLNNVVEVEPQGEFDLMLYRQAQQNSLDLKDHDQRLRRDLWLAVYEYQMKHTSARAVAETEANRAVDAFDKKFNAI